jgi:hypothetical protein
MVEHVRRRVPKRKLSLFGCACIRQTWELLPPPCREAVEITEACGEGGLTPEQLRRRRALLEAADKAYPGSACVRAVVLLPLLESFSSADWRPVCSPRVQCELARCVFDNPFRRVAYPPGVGVWVHVPLPRPREAWAQAEAVRQVAQAIEGEGRYAELPILADALEDAGCTDEEVLAHCRGGWHARGCWVVDLIVRPPAEEAEDRYPLGRLVRHAEHGVGRVTKLGGTGGLRWVSVRFPTGEHKFVVRHANLELIEPD